MVSGFSAWLLGKKCTLHFVLVCLCVSSCVFEVLSFFFGATREDKRGQQQVARASEPTRKFAASREGEHNVRMPAK